MSAAARNIDPRTADLLHHERMGQLQELVHWVEEHMRPGEPEDARVGEIARQLVLEHMSEQPGDFVQRPSVLQGLDRNRRPALRPEGEKPTTNRPRG